MHCDSFYNYLTTILQPNKENLIKLAKSIGKEFDDLNELCNDNEVKKLILTELQKYGKSNGLTSKELPYAIKLCPEEWTGIYNFLNNKLLNNKIHLICSFSFEWPIDSVVKDKKNTNLCTL